MTALGQQFPFVARASELGAASLAPMLPLMLVANRSVPVSGLLDTGAAVNVLPYSHGVELGFDWTVPVILGQVNFFLEFDVCFFRSRSLFEIRPARRQ